MTAIRRRLDSRSWDALGLLLAAALLLRLWAMRWPPFPIDMNDWIIWGDRVRTVGPLHFYATDVFADYAPGYVYVLWLIASLKHVLVPDAGLGVVHFLYRLPALFCDLAITAVIFITLRDAERSRGAEEMAEGEHGGRWPLLAIVGAACYALNPAVIINSAVWGQIDSTFTLAMLLSLLLLLGRRPEAALAWYAVAFLVKPQSISIAPVVGIYLVLRFPPRQVARALAIGAGVGLVLLVPFFGLRFWDLLPLLRRSTDTYKYTSLFSYNLWGVFGFWLPDSTPVANGVSARAAGLILFSAGLVYGAVLLARDLRRRRHDDRRVIFLFASYFAFLPVMVLTRMHERYLFPLLPFLLIFAFLCLMRQEQSEREDGFDAQAEPRFLGAPLILFVAISALHAFNLYHVYQYYQDNDRGGVPLTNTIFYRIANNAKVWSVLTLFSFTSFLVLIPSWLRPDPDETPAAGTLPPESLSAPALGPEPST